MSQLLKGIGVCRTRFPEWFLIGFGPYSEKEHVGYFIVPGDGVEAIRKGGEKVERWPSIRSLLEHELVRAEAAYPKHEEALGTILESARVQDVRRQRSTRKR